MTQSYEYRRILHRMGYYNYQNGLIYRHFNQDGGWDYHLSRCREYILKAVDHFKPENITVLGSGWLLDLPLAELTERCGKITIVDIIHPPDVLSQAGAFKNIEIREDDVTGGLIKEVWTKTKSYSFFRKMKNLSDIEIPVYRPGYGPGLVISLNILTQLENLPVEFMKKKSTISEDQFLSFRKEVQDKHLEFLKCYRSVLISDIEEIITTKDGKKNVIPTLRTEIPEGIRKEEWNWDFDLRGSDFYNSRSIMKVVAVTFEK